MTNSAKLAAALLLGLTVPIQVPGAGEGFRLHASEVETSATAVGGGVGVAPDPALVAAMEAELLKVSTDPAAARHGRVLGGLDPRYPERRAAFRQALVNVYPKVPPEAQSSLLLQMRFAFPPAEGPYEGPIKDLVLSIIRSHDSQADYRVAVGDAIQLLPAMALSAEEVDELLSQTLIMDYRRPPGPVQFSGRMVCGTGRPRKARGLNKSLLRVVASAAGPDYLERIRQHLEAHTAELELSHADLGPTSNLLLETRQPAFCIDFLAICSEQIAAGISPGESLQQIPHLIVCPKLSLPEPERQQALAILHAVARNDRNIFSSKDSHYVCAQISSILNKEKVFETARRNTADPVALQTIEDLVSILDEATTHWSSDGGGAIWHESARRAVASWREFEPRQGS